MFKYPLLTQKMIDAAHASEAGKYIDELIAKDVEQTGGRSLGPGSIIQQLLAAMIDAQ